MDLKRSDSSITDPPPCNTLGGVDPKECFEAFAHVLQPCRQYASRDARREEAEFFMDCLAEFHHDYPVIQAYTSVRAHRLCSDKWLGITWVALHGIDTICMVVRDNDLLNLKRKLCPGNICDAKYFNRKFWNAIISNVEDIEDFKFGGNHIIPFSVVTVGPSMGCKRIGGQASRAKYSAKKTSKFLQDEMKSCKDFNVSRAKYRAKKTSKFLQDEMKSGAVFTFEKTVLTAISAFQHLFCREFEAHQIRVFVWKTNEVVGREMLQGREIPDLEELLATLRAK